MIEHWNWPQWAEAALLLLALLLAAYQHGKPKIGTNNFAYSVIGSILVITVLYYGGFWTPHG